MVRPIGASLLAILGWMRGLLAMLGGLTGLGLGVFNVLDGFRDAGAIYVHLSSAVLVLGIVTIVISYGLWTIQSWAWMWMVIVQMLSLIIDVIPIFVGGRLTYVGIMLTTISVLIIVYMLTPGVRRAYLRQPN